MCAFLMSACNNAVCHIHGAKAAAESEHFLLCEAGLLFGRHILEFETSLWMTMPAPQDCEKVV